MRRSIQAPPVIVLLPVRDAEATLDVALRSLWRQTFADFEVLAMGDGSRDRSPGILRAHARRESRLTVLTTGGAGLVAALEQARCAAAAPFLARHPVLAARRVAIWGAGRTGRRLSRLLAHEGVEVVRFYDVDPAKIGGTRHRTPVASWMDLETAGTTPLLVAVGAPGARALIRPETVRRGYGEGVDVLFAA